MNGRENTDNTSTDRVLRGGGWFTDDLGLRSASRIWMGPYNVMDFFGFWCARSF